MPEAWSALREGRGAPVPITIFRAGLLDGATGFEVGNWKAERFWRDRKIAYYARASQFALKASEECLEGVSARERHDLGVIVGTRYSTVSNGLQLLDEPDFMTPIKFLGALPSSIPTNVSLSLGLHGITTSVSSSAAGLEALGCARDLIGSGHALALLAGGAEELSAEVYAACRMMGALAGRSGEGGLIPGEAGGMLLLETPEHAAAAGRAPLARIAGTGAAFAPKEGVAPAIDAGRRALEGALAEARLDPADIDVVFLGANGHPMLDQVSRGAVAKVFGRERPVLVAPKAWLGETFGASGAVAAVAAALSLGEGVLPGGLRPPRCQSILIHDYGCEGSHAGLVLRHPDAVFERGA